MKYNADDSVNHYKARLVAKGYAQLAQVTVSAKSISPVHVSALLDSRANSCFMDSVKNRGMILCNGRDKLCCVYVCVRERERVETQDKNRE